MTKVTDERKHLTAEQYGKLRRRLDDLIRRIDQGTLPFRPTMKILQDLIERKAINVVGKHIIDCDANPSIPEGLIVFEHKKGGQLEWNPDKVSLYRSREQRGNKLREELENKAVLNINVLDFLLKYPEIIPDSWKGKYVFFWGTICRDSDRRLCVHYLYWGGGKWRRNYGYLDHGFVDYYRAALLCE